MARMLMAYEPGRSLAAGKLKRPLSSVGTLMVTVEPTCLALTTTPSIKPSLADDTVPASAACGLPSASAAPGETSSASVAAISERYVADITASLPKRRLQTRTPVGPGSLI